MRRGFPVITWISVFKTELDQIQYIWNDSKTKRVYLVSWALNPNKSSSSFMNSTKMHHKFIHELELGEMDKWLSQWEEIMKVIRPSFIIETIWCILANKNLLFCLHEVWGLVCTCSIISKEKVEEGIDFKELATSTEGYSGSDLKVTSLDHWWSRNGIFNWSFSE